MKKYLVEISDIEPHPGNRRELDATQAAERLLSLPASILVKDKDVVTGHARLRAGLDMGLEVKVRDIGTNEEYSVSKDKDGKIVRVDEVESTKQKRRPGPR